MSHQVRLIVAAAAMILTSTVAGPWMGASRLQADESAPGTRLAAAGDNPFPGKFPAPSLDGGTEWLNTSGPISLQDLRGKIVLLDFWTYCCINCMHILPDLKYLEQKYPNQLVVIGVHSAKFDNEKESENIREAIMRYEIEHPVINDSNMVIARKYDFNSWPTLVLIDPEGNFVGRQPGEGNRDLFDQVIGKMVTYHRAKKTLDETPVKFNLERAKAEPTPLRYPGKILADEAGQRLFITDSNHNRIVITSLTGELQKIIGTGAIGAKDGSFDQASFDHPQGLALVGTDLYVADTENHKLRKVDLKNEKVTTIAGTGVQSHLRPALGAALSTKKTPLNSPWALQEFKGMLYIAMAGPHQIWRHKIGSEVITPLVGSGREDIIDGTLQESALAQPSDIVTDGQALYIVDSEGSAVRRIELGNPGSVVTVVGPHDFPQGRSLFEFGDIDGQGDTVRLQHPIGLVYHDGSLYVADTYNDKIKKVDPLKRTAVTWLGTGERGKGLDPVQMSEPAGLAIAGNKMFIADTNNHRILVTDLQSKATQELLIEGLTPPAPAKSAEEENFTGKGVAVPAVTLASGEPAKVEISFELPTDHQLNELAPVIYQVTQSEGSQLIDPAALGKRMRAEKSAKTATLSLPLTGTAGSGEVTLTLTYQYCKHGTGGLCHFGTQQWKIPVTVADQGTSVISLTAKPGQ
ncbi:thioredoxin-like domain-containing protein [Planctomicrobium sp. SH661]|uniref:thioredoxin-like domain-containing protein n=1 Tax=Planctomicrobium sp. SH661 TaxID=3448124 RepID=UPI003F5C762E